MEMRIDYRRLSRGGMRGILEIENYLRRSGLEERLMNLIRLRASQINGCAFCIDMHWKDARAEGDSEQRLYGLDAWAESPYYSERERAALAWTEAVTRVFSDHVPDEVFEVARAQFSDQELADLTLAIATINLWNRLSIALRVKPGEYVAPHRPQPTAH